MTQAAWVKQSTGDRHDWQVDGYTMYTDIDLECNLSHLSLTFNPTVDKQMLGEEISTEGPNHKYSKVLLKFHASHGTVQLEVTIK